MVRIPTGAVVALYAVVIGVPILLNLLGAALGARGAGPVGPRFKAIVCGFGVGIAVTLLTGWLLLGVGAAVLAAPLVGAAVSFAVGRGVVRAGPYQDAQP